MPNLKKTKGSTPVLSRIQTRRGEHSNPSSNKDEEESLLSVEGANGVTSGGSVITMALLAEKLDHIVMRLDKLDSVDARLEELEGRLTDAIRKNTKLEVRLANLEDRLDTLETANRRTNLVLSGEAVSKVSPTDNLRDSVTNLLKSTVQYELKASELSSLFRLGKKPPPQSPDRRSILLNLQDEDTKRDILLACRRVRPKGLYANEDLTPHRASLLFAVRRAKKEANGKIAGCGSINGRIFAYLKPPNPEARQQRVFIDNFDRLRNLCQQELIINYDNLLSDVHRI